MAKFNEGYKNIRVKLIEFEENIADKLYRFGRYGSDHFKIPSDVGDKEYENDKEVFVDELLNGLTFPKLAFEGIRFNFQIEGISRICLAQLTRDAAIFCSESHGLRPLTQEFNIPLNIYNDKSIMEKLDKAQKLLEEAYIEACEKEIPYPESRYICLHSQTISLCASFVPSSFIRACYSRTNNSFCDELNYVYRKMFYELSCAISKISDDCSRRIWRWLINEDKCIDDNYYTRTNVFNSDFNWDKNRIPKIPAQNDWRKSCWKLELERISEEEPWLLTYEEIKRIHEWCCLENDGQNLPTSYSQDTLRIAKNAIKEMDYYGK